MLGEDIVRVHDNFVNLALGDGGFGIQEGGLILILNMGNTWVYLVYREGWGSDSKELDISNVLVPGDGDRQREGSRA